MAKGNIHIRTEFDAPSNLENITTAVKAISDAVAEADKNIKGLGESLTGKITLGIDKDSVQNEIVSALSGIDIKSSLLSKLQGTFSDPTITKALEENLKTINIDNVAAGIKAALNQIAQGTEAANAKVFDMATAFEAVIQSINKVQGVAKDLQLDTVGLDNVISFIKHLEQAINTLNNFSSATTENLGNVSAEFEKTFAHIAEFTTRFNDALASNNIDQATEVYQRFSITFLSMMEGITGMMGRVAESTAGFQANIKPIEAVMNRLAEAMMDFIKKFTELMGKNRLPELSNFMAQFAKVMDSTANLITVSSQSMGTAFQSIGVKGERLREILTYVATALNQFSEKLTADGLKSGEVLGKLAGFINAFKGEMENFDDILVKTTDALDGFAQILPNLSGDASLLQGIAEVIKSVAVSMEKLSKISFDDIQGVESLKQILNDIATEVVKFGEAIVATFGEQSTVAIKNLASLFGNVGTMVEKIASNLVKASQVINQTNTATGEQTSRMKSIFDDLGDAITSFVTKTKGKLNLLPETLNAVAKYLNALTNSSGDLKAQIDMLVSSLSRVAEVLPAIQGDSNMIAALSKYIESVASASRAMVEFSKQADVSVVGMDENISKANETLQAFLDTLKKGSTDVNVKQFDAITKAFNSLSKVLLTLSSDMSLALDNVSGKTSNLQQVLDGVRSALNSFAAGLSDNALKASSSLKGLATLINSIGRITEGFVAKSNTLADSLGNVASVLPGAFADASGLNAISKYILGIEKLADSVKKIGTLSVEDIKNFKTNLASIIGVANQTGNAIKNIGHSAETSGKRLQGFGNIMRYIFMGGGIYYFVRVIRQFISTTLKEFNDLNTALVSFQAITGAANSVMTDLRTNINKVARDFGFAQSEIAGASVTLAKAGLEAEDIAGSIYAISTLARAALEDVSFATKIATTVMLAFNKNASDMASISNTLTAAILNSKLELKDLETQLNYTAATAGAAGIEFEDLATALAQMANTGIKASQIGTSLRGIIGLLLAPTGKFQSMLNSLGVTMEDINPKTHSLVEIIRTLADAGLDVTKIYASMDKRMAQGMTALVSNVEQLESMEVKLQNASSAFEIADTQMGSFSASARRFAAVIQANLADSILGFLEKMGRFLTVISEAENKTKIITKLLKALGVVIATLVTVHLLNWITSLKIATAVTHTFAFAIRGWTLAEKAAVIVLEIWTWLLQKKIALTIKAYTVDKIALVIRKLNLAAIKQTSLAQIFLNSTIIRAISNIIVLTGVTSLSSAATAALTVKVVALGIALAATFSIYYLISALVGWIVKANSSTLDYVDTMKSLREINVATNKTIQKQSDLLKDATQSWVKFREEQLKYKADVKDLFEKGGYGTIAKQIRTGIKDEPEKQAGNIEVLVSKLIELETVLGKDVLKKFFTGDLFGSVDTAYVDKLQNKADLIKGYETNMKDLIEIYYEFDKMDKETKELIHTTFKEISYDTDKLKRLLDELIDKYEIFIMVQLASGKRVDDMLASQILTLTSMMEAREKLSKAESEISNIQLSNALTVEKINRKIVTQEDKIVQLEIQRAQSLYSLHAALERGRIGQETYAAAIALINKYYDESVGKVKESIDSLNELNVAIENNSGSLVGTRKIYGDLEKAQDGFISKQSEYIRQTTGLFNVLNTDIEALGRNSSDVFTSLATDMASFAVEARAAGWDMDKIAKDIDKSYRSHVAQTFEEIRDKIKENGVLTASMAREFENLIGWMGQSPGEVLNEFRTINFLMGDIHKSLVGIMEGTTDMIPDISTHIAKYSTINLLQERLVDIKRVIAQLQLSSNVLIREQLNAYIEEYRLTESNIKALEKIASIRELAKKTIDESVEKQKEYNIELEENEAKLEEIKNLHKQLDDSIKDNNDRFREMLKDVDLVSKSTWGLVTMLSSFNKRGKTPVAEDFEKLEAIIKEIERRLQQEGLGASEVQDLNDALARANTERDKLIKSLAKEEEYTSRKLEQEKELLLWEEEKLQRERESIQAELEYQKLREEHSKSVIELEEKLTGIIQGRFTLAELENKHGQDRLKYLQEYLNRLQSLKELEELEIKIEMEGGDEDLLKQIRELKGLFRGMNSEDIPKIVTELAKAKQEAKDNEKSFNDVVASIDKLYQALLKIITVLDTKLGDARLFPNLDEEKLNLEMAEQTVDRTGESIAEASDQARVFDEAIRSAGASTKDLSSDARAIGGAFNNANSAAGQLKVSVDGIKNGMSDVKSSVDNLSNSASQANNGFISIGGTIVELSKATSPVKESFIKIGEASELTLESMEETTDVLATKGIDAVTEFKDISLGIWDTWVHILDLINMFNAMTGGGGMSINIGEEAGAAFGGLIKMAGGGRLRGAGKSFNDISDRIPAWLSNGEFVINSFSTRLFEPLLNMINYKPMSTMKLLSGYGNTIKNIVAPAPKSPHYAIGGRADSSMYREPKNERAINLYIDNEPYKVYTDEEVANKMIRAFNRRSQTRKY